MLPIFRSEKMKSSTDGREKLFPTFSPMRSTLGILFGRKPTRGILSHISSVRTRAKKEQYYVENTHQAIVEKSVWHAVAELRMQRAGEKHPEDYYAPSAFRKKVLCGCCSSMFRLRQNRGCTYWSCRQHDIDRNSCPNSQIPETVMQEAFCRLYYKLKHHGSPIFTQMLSNLQKIRYSRMLWSEDVISLNKKNIRCS